MERLPHSSFSWTIKAGANLTDVNSKADLSGVAELLLSKQRNVLADKVKLVFLKEYTKFENAAAGIDDSVPEE